MTSTTGDALTGVKGAGWIMIAAGAISLIAGLLAIAYPDITLVILAIFTGVNLIVLGALSVADAFHTGDDGTTRAVSAVLGMLGLIAGLVVLRRPGETLLVLVLAIGIWLVVSGVVHFLRAFQDLEDRALRLLVAIGEIVLGGLILVLPDLSLRTVAVLAGISFVLRGLHAVYAGWKLRRAGHSASGRLAPAA